MNNGLIENKNVRQREEEGFRRWFLNDFFDVIIWYDKPRGSMKGFQVCYSKNRNEKAFTWSERMASSRYVSDDEDGRPRPSNMTAILSGDAGTIPEKVIGRLMKESGELDKNLLHTIVTRIRAYNINSYR